MLWQEGRAVKTRWIANGTQPLVPMQTVAPNLEESAEATSESTGLVSSGADSEHAKQLKTTAILERMGIIKEKWSRLPTAAKVGVAGLLIVVLITVVMLVASGSEDGEQVPVGNQEPVGKQQPVECGLNATAVAGESPQDSCLCDDGFIDEPGQFFDGNIDGCNRACYAQLYSELYSLPNCDFSNSGIKERCQITTTRCRSCGDHASIVDGKCECDSGFINDLTMARAQQFAWDTWDHSPKSVDNITDDRTYGFMTKLQHEGWHDYVPNDDALHGRVPINVWSDTGHAHLRTAKLACRPCGNHGTYTPGADGAAPTCVCHDTGDAANNYEGAFCEFPPRLARLRRSR